jgi:beta-glucosidase
MKKQTKNTVRISLISLAICGMLLGVGTVASTGSRALAHYRTNGSGGKFYCDYPSIEETEKAAVALNEQIADESMILMKNKDNMLPFSDVKNVSIFGKHSLNLAGRNTNNSEDIYAALEAAGYNTNQALKEFYANDARSGSTQSTKGSTGFGPAASRPVIIGETPVASYDDSVQGSFNYFNDAAIVVITRSADEGADSLTYNAKDYDADPDNTKHVLQLSNNESAMIKMVEDKFSKVVVVLNARMTLQIGELADDDKIGGIIWAGEPGNNGWLSLGRILNGTVNPSGHTVDTWARDFTKDPTFQNFGDNSQTNNGKENYYVKDADGNAVKVAFDGGMSSGYVGAIEYEEGIYIGYRYYETMDAIQKAAGVTDWYKKNVAYPFGYGLSYTSFDTAVEAVSTLDKNGTAVASIDTAGKIQAKVKVTNTGKVAGKHVVELYYHAPYTSGKIEKAEVNLAAFQKTEVLQPGKSQELTLEFYVQDMASYDFSDANGDGHKGYELDPGEYKISVRSDAHTVIGAETSLTLAGSVVHYDTDRITGNTVSNKFTGDDNYYSSLPGPNDVPFVQMSRADGFTTSFPKAPAAGEYQLKTGNQIADRVTHVFTDADLETGTMGIPVKTAADATGLTQADSTADPNRKCAIQLKDLLGVDYENDEKWNALLNQLTWMEIVNLIANLDPAISCIGKQKIVPKDTPTGWDTGKATCIYAGGDGMATTWNPELGKKKGEMLGNECLWDGIQAWYGPACDMHRSPFGGRNGEYYSEDPLLSGAIASAEIEGAQDKGLIVYLKHFALNDQETSRHGLITYATEQAMREIYFKPFQMTVEEAHVNGMMNSFNRIGLVEDDGNYALTTSVLRDEWNFKGVCITDAFGNTSSGSYQNRDMGPVVGSDLVLGFNDITKYTSKWDDTAHNVYYTAADGTKKTSYTQWLAFRRAARRILYNAVNANAFSNLLDTSLFQGQTLNALRSVAYSKSIAVDASALGTANVTYELTSGALPTGMTMSSNGLISGTCMVNGTYTFSVTMHSDSWINTVADYTLVVSDAFAYTGSDLTKAAVDTAFDGQFSSEAVNTTNYETVTYRLDEGSELPDGLEMDATGHITGTPTVGGTYTFTIKVDATSTKFVFPFGNRTVHSYFTQTVTIDVTPKSYAVTFKDGTSSVSASEVVSGQTVAVPANPVKDGYIFTGWYTDAACTKAADFSKAIVGETTFYAGWAQEYVPAETTGEINSAADSINSGVSSQIAGVNANVSSAAATASDAQTAAKKANSVGVTGIVVGVVGIIVGACGVVLALMAKKKPL